ncbi:hypothetical protein HPG69_000113 [Diceros bicornis minor]|uniref:Uncharacterized protein n=1 Tax=Diceros bicornis minor TaxID=77932 RepID=A0A7J7EVA0_DICBM|nr:hypothetical protein HPG69_000113 [Diceros bicornis minor]
MKLVTPEDDEPDEPKPVVLRQAEPNPDDTMAKQKGTVSDSFNVSVLFIHNMKKTTVMLIGIWSLTLNVMQNSDSFSLLALSLLRGH